MTQDPPIIIDDEPEPLPPPPATLQGLVHRTTREIVGHGLFPAGTPNPDLEVVDLEEEQRPILQQPGTKVLNADGSITVTPPPPPPVQFQGSEYLYGTVSTTGTTPAVLYRRTMPQKTEFDYEIKVNGVHRTNGSVKRLYAQATYKRLLQAPIQLVLYVPAPAQFADTGAASWTVTTSISGNDILVTVVGSAGQVDWSIRGSLDVFAPEGI